MKRLTRAVAMTALMGVFAFGLGAGRALAGIEVKATIYKKGATQPISGMVRALPSSRKYVVTQGNFTLEVDAYTVERIDMAKPAELDAAVRLLSSNPGAAVAPLKKIVDDYKMFPWGVTAGRYLLDAYMRSKQPAEAVRAAEALVADDPAAKTDPEFLTKYWEAMIGADREAGLESSLTEAIQKGPREVAAVAFIKRGDIHKKKGNCTEALISGYLRTVELFREVKEIQPEALYKASRCFEELGRASQAERMRKRLLADYDKSEWADRMRSGK
jgi:tetratricopeptide (TPR) repeat protein